MNEGVKQSFANAHESKTKKKKKKIAVSG